MILGSKGTGRRTVPLSQRSSAQQHQCRRDGQELRCASGPVGERFQHHLLVEKSPCLLSDEWFDPRPTDAVTGWLARAFLACFGVSIWKEGGWPHLPAAAEEAHSPYLPERQGLFLHYIAFISSCTVVYCS